MSLLLYINGQLADLDAGQVIAQTKQVNDLNSLDNRQASYTNKFKLPKTATNVKIMDYLTVTGNNSNIPYQKNECSLFSETGECFVYNGWAVITDAGSDYEAVIYDGIVSLYKAIENQTLADLPLETELNHKKTMANVTNSWTDINCKYKYILADYNGRTSFTWINTNVNPFMPILNCIDMDYLIPSVSVAYLWDSIFNLYGFSYGGSVFETEDFNNLYITFPAGITTDDLNETLLQSDDFAFAPFAQYYGYTSYYLKFNTADVNILPPAFSNIFFQVPQTGVYRLEISGSIKKSGEPTKIYLVKNSMFTPINLAPEYQSIKNNLESEEAFDVARTFNLQANDTIAIVVKASVTDTIFSGYNIDGENSALNVKLTRVDGEEVNFKKAFSGFSIRDFVNEIVYRFGLTLYKDNFYNSYTFLTLKEQLQTPNLQDWSKKFIRKISEKYEFSNYAQKNYLRYAYNNNEDSYHDASFDVANVNLPESKDILKSKIYAPDEKPGSIGQKPSNIYRLWDKELVENTDEEGNTTVETVYKSLDNHFYFLKYANQPFSPAKPLVSKTYNEVYMVHSAPFESFYKLPFLDVVQDYYTSLNAISDKAQIVTAEFWLTDNDVANFDFKKLYYLEQLSSYFIMNKINNYVPGKPTKCDLVKVQYTGEAQPYLALTHMQINGLTTSSHYTSGFSNTTVILQYYQHYNNTDEIVWQNASGGTESPILLTFPFAGTFTVRLWCNGLTSNSITITLPSNQTLYAS